MTPATATLMLGLASQGEGGGFDATTAILVVLAAIAGYLVYEFIRENRGRSALAIVGAVIGHILLVVFLSLDIPGRLGCGVEDEEPELIEFEVAQIDEPEPEEPEPEPEEPEPEPEPEPTPVKQEQPKEVKPKPKKAPEPPPDPPSDEPPPPKRFDMSMTGQGNTGVKVPIGKGGEYGGTGKPDSKGTKKGPPKGDPKGEDDGKAAKWQPRSELFIKTLPKVSKQPPKIDCPATAQLGVEGEVVLKVQIARDGTIRSVKVVKGIGQGCDQVAVKALKKAKFKPAVGTNGKPVDFELRYEYAFTVND